MTTVRRRRIQNPAYRSARLTRPHKRFSAYDWPSNLQVKTPPYLRRGFSIQEFKRYAVTLEYFSATLLPCAQSTDFQKSKHLIAYNTFGFRNNFFPIGRLED